ncbi:hypothetical protein [Actinokineospora terrae]|uniref:Uncharacterized protein n=1 Tax=Actinokineospora terrae TaxID=155974 RepID=A0A1H9XQH8_9PSEU|nr:hypothetical protein [Actinokineospora terrae]SES48047.1 hypothetical protein SAMN04487818_11869 [Actinokineospora terrae]
MSSFQTGQARLTGPGEDYQSQLAQAGQRLAQIAEHNAAGEHASRTLQVVEGLVVAYSGAIGRADSFLRSDRGSALGIAALWDAHRLLSAPDSGILAQLDVLAAQQRASLDEQLGHGWMSGWVVPLWALPAVALLVLLVWTQVFLRARFRRALNAPLIAATVLAGLVAAVLAVVVGHAHREVAAVDEAVAAVSMPADAFLLVGERKLGDLLAGQCAGQCGDAVDAFVGSLPATVAEPDRAIAVAEVGPVYERLAGVAELWVVLTVPALLAVAVLVVVGLRPRLEEYRYSSR